MPIEQILGAIIILLIGLLIGGAGGQALVRRAVGNITGQNDGSTTAAMATTAASAAATAAASLSNHVSTLQATTEKQWDTLNKIQQEQTRLATAFEQFPATCKLRHEAIDREQGRIREEIDSLRTRA